MDVVCDTLSLIRLRKGDVLDACASWGARLTAAACDG